jgi:hypothetical protein
MQHPMHVLRSLTLAIMFTNASLARASFVTVVRTQGTTWNKSMRRSCFAVVASSSSGWSPCAVRNARASSSLSPSPHLPARRQSAAVTASSTITARFLSGSSDSSETTSVVDTCQRKIRNALDAVEVKVTGALRCVALRQRLVCVRRLRMGCVGWSLLNALSGSLL